MRITLRSRLLHLALGLVALVPASALAGSMDCGSAVGHASCCCEPAAPVTGACGEVAPAASLKPSACGCRAAPPAPVPAAPQQIAASVELSLTAALPSHGAQVLEGGSLVMLRSTAPVDAPRAGGTALLRLHCVILI